MALPQATLDFLNENARMNGLIQLVGGEDLFQSGALDSFALVDFVTVLEEHCGVHIPDTGVIPENFRTVAAIEAYVSSLRGEN
jgi:acyl carrier protein